MIAHNVADDIQTLIAELQAQREAARDAQDRAVLSALIGKARAIEMDPYFAKVEIAA